MDLNTLLLKLMVIANFKNRYLTHYRKKRISPYFNLNKDSNSLNIY